MRLIPQVTILISPLILLLAMIGLVALLVLAIFGLFVIISLFKAKRLPMDTSNRINHIRLLWFVITRPELFVSAFPWLKNDELDNFKQK